MRQSPGPVVTAVDPGMSAKLAMVSKPSRSPAVPAAISLVALCLVLWGRVLAFPFVWDDRNLIVDNPFLGMTSTLWEAFEHGFWQLTNSPKASAMYRPLVMVSYWCEARVWGLAPYGFHLTGLGLHILNTLLVLQLLRRLGLEVWAAAAGAAIFATHPVQVQAAANIASRPDLLACFGMLLGAVVWTGSRRWRWLAPLPLAAALLCKEVALVGPLLTILLASMVAPPASRLRWLPLTAWVPFLVLRVSVLGVGWNGGQTPGPWSGSLRMLRYLLRVVWPSPQPPYVEWTSSGWWGTVVAAVILVSLAVLTWRLGARAKMGVAWLLLALLPVSEIVPMGVRFTDLLLYVPMVGVAMLVGAHVDWSVRRFGRRPLVAAIAALLVAGVSLTSAFRLEPWSSEVALWSHGLSLDPGNPTMSLNLANALDRAGRPVVACEQQRATLSLLETRPNPDTEVKAHYNLGNCALQAGDPVRALVHYRRAYDESRGEVHQAGHNAVIALQQLGRTDEAATFARRLARDQPGLASSWRLLGVAEAKVGRWEAARDAFDRALRLAPNDVATERMRDAAERMRSATQQ